ncbi:hypothetical protein NIES2100_40570 [Calothrix sp. NIES-2100]|uniref:DUF11 domain-containing protein n=1 Tax=Calothrix sp. NIES-2100 TaxID=1954172 RepID=UPI000B613016|nr:hypothetical protein NIES2100_40570 [Calothrix sp. NIES-2100]
MTKNFVRKANDFDEFKDLFGGKTNPKGLVFSAKDQKLLLLQKGEDDQTELKVTELAPSGEVQAGNSVFNTAFDAKRNRILSFNAESQQILVNKINADGRLDLPKQQGFDIRKIGLKKPQGFTVAPDGTLLFLENRQIIAVTPGESGSFTDAKISRINLKDKKLNKVSGIAVDPNTGNLQLLIPDEQRLVEINLSGETVSDRNLNQVGISKPEAITFAPTLDATDAPSQYNLYVSDANLGIAELSFAEPLAVAAATTTTLTLVRTIDTSVFSPSSPDPSGIAYNPYTNRLLIADGEVDEMSIFRGVNMFERSVSGTGTTWDRTWSTTSFSNEPTGVDIYFNPSNSNDPFNGFLVVSDDDQRRIHLINPVNGVYGDTGDVRTVFSTTPFGSGDPEGIAFGPKQIINGTERQTLFVLDGVNAEVYQVTTDGTLVSHFDTAGLGFLDPEGIDYDPLSGSIYLIGEPINTIAEVSISGSLIQSLNISGPGLRKPAGLTIAPTSNNSNTRSIYVADRGVDNDNNPNENDGKIFEFILPAAPPPPSGADLELTQTVSNPTPNGGQNVTFTLTLNNRGPQNTNSVAVTDQLPTGLTFVSATSSLGSYNSSTGVWNVGTINSGSNATLNLVATVQTTPTSTITNTAQVTASSVTDPDSTPNNNNPNEDDQASASIGPNVVTRQIRVSAGSDDAEQSATGSVSLTSSDLELVNDGNNQTVGLRFNSINVPKGVTITNAYIQFKVDETSTTATNLTIQGQAIGNAPTFTSASNNISSRSKTTASVTWNPTAWNSVGAAGVDQRTNNIASVIQEIINRPDWASNNSLVTIITGTGARVAESFEGDAAGAPLLHIEYIDKPPAPGADLSLTSTVNNSNPLLGNDITFSVNVNNTGPDAATGVQVTDLLPSGLTFVSATQSQGSYSSSTGLWTVGTVNNGATATLTLTARAANTGSFSNTAQVTASNQLDPDSTPGNNIAGEDDQATVAVNVTDGSGVPTAIAVRVASSSDDAEQRASGSMDLSSSDLELINDGGDQLVGLRFVGVNIPQGATINKAYIQFKVDETTSVATNLTIRGQDADNALTFTSTRGDISSRLLTDANAVWNAVPTWNTVGTVGADQRTPDLKNVIQEIVNRQGWSSGNSLATIISGTGSRVAEAFDGDQLGAPLLYVEFTA